LVSCVGNASLLPDMNSTLWLLLAGVSAGLAVLRLKLLRSAHCTYVDPVLWYHATWAGTLAVYGVYRPLYHFRLDWPFDVLLVAYIVVLGAGLWLGCPVSRMRRRHAVDHRCPPHILPASILLRTILMMAVDVVAGLLLASVLARGYPLKAMFSDRSFANMASSFKEIVGLVFLEGLQVSLAFDFFLRTDGGIHDVGIIGLAIVPSIIRTGLTAGRSALVLQVLLLALVWLSAEHGRSLFSRKGLALAGVAATDLVCLFVVVAAARRSGALVLPGLADFRALLDYIVIPIDGFGYALQPGLEQLHGRALTYIFPWVANQLGRFLPGYGPLDKNVIASVQTVLRTIDDYLVTATRTAFGDFQLGLGTFWGLAWALGWGLIVGKVHTTAVRLNRFGWTVLSCLDVLVVAWTPQMYYYFSSWYVLTLLAAWVCLVLGNTLRASLWLRHSCPVPEGHHRLDISDSSTASQERQ